MKNWKSILVVAAVVAIAIPAVAQENAVLGVYFDLDATQNTAIDNGGVDVTHTAYVMVKDGEQMVGGAAFKLLLDPRILLTDVSYPYGFQYGEITGFGIEVGLNQPVIGYYGNPALIATLSLNTLNNLMDNAVIQILPNEKYTGITISDDMGHLREVPGVNGYLTIPVPDETTSWGSMKSLYND